MGALWADLARLVKGIPLTALLAIGSFACIVLWIAMILSLPHRARGGHGAAPARPPPATDAPWYYSGEGPHEGRVEGPLHIEGLAALVASGAVSSEARVWRRGMAGWVPLSEVPALRKACSR